MSISTKPQVSVVLCTYNGANFLAVQLDAVLQQSWPIHELVVVDDASTDATFTILETFAQQHACIRLFRNPEQLGYNKNFERALTLATGDVLAITDQDDVWHPQKIERMLAAWTDGSPLIYCDSIRFWGEIPEKPKPGRLMNRVWGTDPRKLALYNTVCGHALLLRRSLLPLALPFDKDIYYDWWLALVATCNGGVAYLPEILVYQRQHQHNASLPLNVKKAAAYARDRKMILHNLSRFVDTPNMKEEDRKFFERLRQLWQQSMEGKSGPALLAFLLRYRSQIYASKKRKLALLSQLKRSLRYAFVKG